MSIIVASYRPSSITNSGQIDGDIWLGDQNDFYDGRNGMRPVSFISAEVMMSQWVELEADLLRLHRTQQNRRWSRVRYFAVHV